MEEDFDADFFALCSCFFRRDGATVLFFYASEFSFDFVAFEVFTIVEYLAHFSSIIALAFVQGFEHVLLQNQWHAIDFFAKKSIVLFAVVPAISVQKCGFPVEFLDEWLEHFAVVDFLCASAMRSHEPMFLIDDGVERDESVDGKWAVDALAVIMRRKRALKTGAVNDDSIVRRQDCLRCIVNHIKNALREMLTKIGEHAGSWHTTQSQIRDDLTRFEIVDKAAQRELLFDLVQPQIDLLHRRENLRVVPLDIERHLCLTAHTNGQIPQRFKERSLHNHHK